MTPIVLLHHNEFDYLNRTIQSIYENTNLKFKLYVVDNKSKENSDFWNILSHQYPDINIIFNKKNNWVYGFNEAIKIIDNFDYIVLSDSDIVVNPPINNKCWLGYLIESMNANACIGKLGLNLDLSSIKNQPGLVDLYLRELSYYSGLKICDNTIAPVDTTLAIYRGDLFITNFYMRVGHASLVRPNYYVCRANGSYLARHLGWDKYINIVNNNIGSNDLLNEKLNFFAKYGIHVEKNLISKAKWPYRIKYYLIFKLSRFYYGLKVLYYWLIFLFNNFPGNINHIQK